MSWTGGVEATGSLHPEHVDGDLAREGRQGDGARLRAEVACQGDRLAARLDLALLTVLGREAERACAG